MIGAPLLIGLAAPVRAEPPGALPTTRAASDPHFAAFNGDGYSDLAVAGDRDPEDRALEGVVRVRYGSKDGVTSASSQTWTADSFGADRDDEFGSALATGDFGATLTAGNFGRTAFADLAIGVPGEKLNGVSGAGAVNVIYGSPSGLAAVGTQRWSAGSPGVPGRLVEEASFGKALVAGHFSGTEYDDLAIGAPDEPVAGRHAAGAVTVVRGSAAGLTARGSQRWTQATQRIAGKPGVSDGFGWSLAAANFGRDDRGSGRDDLAVGIPGEPAGGRADAGAVQVIYGSTKGLTSAGSRKFSRATAGVLGPARREAQFGWTLTTGEFGRTRGGEPLADLVATGMDEGVNILYASESGLSTRRDQYLPGLGFVLPGN